MATQATQAALISQDDVAKLKEFHASHFPGQIVPSMSSSQHGVHVQEDRPSQDDPTSTYSDDDDGLGYYPDGVKRTLTDEQVRMFRHSEIQRLLAGRREARQEAEEAKEAKERAERKTAKDQDQARRKQQQQQRFDYDRATQQDNVQTLMYDDAPSEQSTKPTTTPAPAQTTDTDPHNKNKQFLWPTLRET